MSLVRVDKVLLLTFASSKLSRKSIRNGMVALDDRQYEARAL
jgi:hypothetical protein